MRLLRGHVKLVLAAAALSAGLVAFVLVYFAPQDLLINTTVNEPLPRATAVAGGRAGGRLAGAPQVLTRGKFRSGEHHTTGTARLLRLADGRVFVRLTDFATSNGPAVRIWLSAADYRASNDAVGRARHLDLGGLKANRGNENYPVPRATDLALYRSVVVWCRRFDVVFGAAALTPVAPA